MNEEQINEELAAKEERELESLAENRRPQRAAHEAGHAIADYVLGIEFFEVHIIRKGNESGNCSVVPSSWDSASPKTKIVSLLAGGASEQHFYATNYGSVEDLKMVFKILENNHFIDRHTLHVEVKELISAHSRAVEAVRDELVKQARLSFDEVALLAEQSGSKWNSIS